MWASLCKIADLPPDTEICSGHEYTAANAKFALTIDPDNEALKKRFSAIKEAREAGIPTVPSSLALEMGTNPFLRAADPEVREILNMKTASDVEVFAEIRKRKDAF